MGSETYPTQVFWEETVTEHDCPVWGQQEHWDDLSSEEHQTVYKDSGGLTMLLLLCYRLPPKSTPANQWYSAN